MDNREIIISFEEYSSLEELSAQDKALAKEALQAMQTAYAPYSHFHVGAAVRLEGGIIVRGSNQENAAFPSGICAERTAMFSASAGHPDKAMESIAVAGGVMGLLSDSPASPCGACRQVMAQYQTKAGKDMSVILVGAKSIYKFKKVDDLLPLIFDNI